jgi:molybdenum cofactor cytidylyltransferase
MDHEVPICAVLLAAGASTRFGAENKLLANVGGTPLIARAASRLVTPQIAQVIAVIAPGAEGETVAAAIRNLPLSTVINTQTGHGMGTSIACGAAAVRDPAAGIMMVPADMPSLDPELLSRLIAVFRGAGGKKIAYPVTPAGAQRNPVIWPAHLRQELMALNGAAGGKPLLAAHRESVVTITAESDRPFDDIDTQEDLSRVLKAGV